MRYDRAILKYALSIYCRDEACFVLENKYEQQRIKKANKSERWMPRLWEAMKDVISCDKLGGGANNL